MGCGPSSGGGGAPRDEAQDLKSKQLEHELEQQQKEEDAIIKLLVLGTGESGKSTVFKQMKILYSVPDPPAKFVMICRANLFGNAHAVMRGMQRLDIKFGSPEGEKAGGVIDAVPADGNPDNLKGLPEALGLMWGDKGVQEAIERAAEFQLNDSTTYFWNRASEICNEDYQPTEQDVLRARVRTTGIVQQNFAIKDKKYTMFDVGGQRNERRKWIHCFDNVTAVIFVTAISEYDQVLYEDEKTNRMDEALILFDQICNHPSFKKTSMILFLNKRDLFEMKLAKKNLTCWDTTAPSSQDYDTCITYIKQRFLDKNNDKVGRQVYCHATCATDTSNIAFVMESVFDIILKDNLRKLAKADLSKLMDAGGGDGTSQVKTGPAVWDINQQGKILLAASFYTESLSERTVLVNESNIGQLPAVEIQLGLNVVDSDWSWIMGLGKNLPKMEVTPAEVGSFKGNFKQAAAELRTLLGTDDVGFVYDTQISMKASGGPTTVIACVRKLPKASPFPGMKWVVHEEFENENLAKYAGVDTKANPCKPPPKNEEFNPFAPNPVGARWFKGITLFTQQVSQTPDKGVYLGIFKVNSTPTGFKVMVNEHNRIMIPLIFLTESQLNDADKKWAAGVRVRESFGIDLLEGKAPNRGWLGPEMSGEEGATFPEKLWWAIDEAKARLSTENLGSQYDFETLDIDEDNKIQMLMFGMLASGEDDILPGHIWVEREFLEVQNMKYYCPNVLQNLLTELNGKMSQYQAVNTSDTADMASAAEGRKKKESLKAEIEKLYEQQTPLKWVNRVIMWCADKMPSFADQIANKGAKPGDVVEKAIAANTATAANSVARNALLQKYK